MGLLADIYLAHDDAHALTVRLHAGRIPRSPSVRRHYRTSTVHALGHRARREMGGEVAATIRQRVPSGDGEVLISRVPVAMLNELINLSPEQISCAAQKWAATQEMSCKPTDARKIIEGLITSARKAADTKRNVYLWNSV